MIQYASFSDKGEREINEDSVVCCEKNGKYVFVVADGLGGHDSGEVASATATQTTRELFEKQSEFDFAETIEEVNKRLLQIQKAQNNIRGYKTTYVGLEINEGTASCAHSGDSRLYSFYLHSKDKWVRTKDHSVPEVLFRSGEIKEKEMRHHPDRSGLLKALGVSEEVKYEVDFLHETPADAYLLCSDGFWEWITEKQMWKLLKKANTAEEWLGNMVSVVKKQGAGKGMDNYSIICVWC